MPHFLCSNKADGGRLVTLCHVSAFTPARLSRFWSFVMFTKSTDARTSDIVDEIIHVNIIKLINRAVTHSRIDSRIYGVSRYERYVTRTS